MFLITLSAFSFAGAIGCLAEGDEEAPAVISGAFTDDLKLWREHGAADAGVLDAPVADVAMKAAQNEIQVATAALAAPPAPLVIYLNYADGNSTTKAAPDPCPATAPKFVCQFGTTLKSCQQQVQTYLDRWYADFNVVFTLTRPTSGTYYTEVVSSGGGAWCGVKDTVAGIAPFLCSDIAGGTAYTFAGGRTAKETAVIIAQEQAHLVGLEHSSSNADLMYPTICSGCDGFENKESATSGDLCNRAKQNSYQMMKDRLGAWTGGVKPRPFGCDMDLSAPSVSILEPSDKATVAATFLVRALASDDCKISKATIRVSPMGLQADATTAPFEWTLARIKGQQTISITVTDPSNKTTTTSITVNAPGTTTGTGGSGTGGKAGTGGATMTATGGKAGTGGKPGTGGATGTATGGKGVGGAAGRADAGANPSDAATANQAAASGCEVGGCAVGSPRDSNGEPSRLPNAMSLLLATAMLKWTSRRRSRKR